MASPSTNPSSCDSTANDPPVQLCTAAPSANQQYTNSVGVSSPALAQAVPVSDPCLPEPTGPKIFLSTAMANQAALDLQAGKAKSIREWYLKYQEGLPLDERQRLLQWQHQMSLPPHHQQRKMGPLPVQQPPPQEPQAQPMQKATKRKARTTPSPGHSKNMKEEPSEGHPPVHPPDQAVDPLRRMEMMANSNVFRPSSRITEVVAANQIKKERAGKATPEASHAAENLPQSAATQQSQQLSSFRHPHPFAGYPFPPFMHQNPPGMPPMAVPPGFPPPPFNPAVVGGTMPPHQISYQQMRVMYLHHQRMMAARAAQMNQMSPMGYPGMPPPPFMPAPMMNGPLSGPLPNVGDVKVPAGPMTAPSGGMPSYAYPFPPIMQSPYALPPPPQGIPPMSGPNGPVPQEPHPAPLFSFSEQPSPHLQDISNMTPGNF